MIGQSISHYKILEKLGEGGMGVVYKAHDLTLDRDVALKFLPREMSPSEEERSRFVHEAKAASALDHPNICTIYEVNETPDGQMFIVMGYYEGKSISKMVEKGRLDVDEAVPIAIQIAEGLQAAHEKGIVHRDIKSSNVIVSNKGQVKILDFGLAKRKGLSKLTKTGTTIGTASYMSPEQAQGESADQRTDLWSLGVVLYEMVTGRLPFRGEHEAAILYSVVNEQPQPIEESVSDASHELIHIIGRALEKDPTERYKSAEDMLIDLRRLKKESSRIGFSPTRGTRKKIPFFRKRVFISGVTIVLLAIAGYLVFMKRGIEINPDMIVRPLKIPFTELSYPGISGDGNWVAFCAKDPSGKWGLYFMHSMGGEPRPIAPISFPTFTDVSFDGRLVLQTIWDNQSGTFTIFIVPSNGVEHLQKIGPGFGGRFRPDGKRLGYILGAGGVNLSLSGKLEFWSVGVDGNDPRREFIDSIHVGGSNDLIPGEFSFSYSPDGKKIAWIRTFPEGYDEIIIHELETSHETKITSDKKRIDELTWIPGDQIVYTTDKSGVFNVWMVSATGGTPVQITKETGGVLGVKCSSDGQKLLYQQLRFSGDFWIVNIAKNRPQLITFRNEYLGSSAFSPDGKKIAFGVGGYGASTPSHLFIMDRDGTNRRQLSFGDENVSQPIWSPDGKRIAFGLRKHTEPVDSFRTYVIELSNPGSLKYIMHGIPNGGWLDSVRFQVQVNNTVYVTSIYGATPKEVYDDSTRAFFIQGGKYIVFHDFHKGKDKGV